MISILRLWRAAALAGLTACAPVATQTAAPVKPGAAGRDEVAPPGAPDGSCWARAVSPAIIETVTEQVLLQAARLRADGTVAEPAAYETETRQAIVRARRETWFETPCEAVQTADFTASLQRALAARGFYRGPITGKMNAGTRAALRRYQAPLGFESDILSLAAARRLGLVAAARAKTG